MTPAQVLAARAVQEIPGQLDMFADCDEPQRPAESQDDGHTEEGTD